MAEVSEAERDWEAQWNDAMDELGEIERLVSGDNPPVGVSVLEQVKRDRASLLSIAEELAEALREFRRTTQEPYSASRRMNMERCLTQSRHLLTRYSKGEHDGS